MILPDINLLLYAYDSKSLYHAKAVEWWQRCLSGSEPVGLASVVLFGFLRIATNGRVFQEPMTPSEAAGHIRSWLAQPIAQVLEPQTDHIGRVLQILETLGTAGNLVTDAQIAALAIEYEAELHTADADFLRIPGVHWLNPITGRSGRNST